MKTRITTALLALGLAFVFTPHSAMAQTAPLPDGALLTKGTVNFAADFAAAPNQFLNADGTKDGLNVDLCGAVGQRLGLKVEWTNLAFPGLVPGLQAQRFDALCTAIFINPDRQKVMNMVPYVRWGEGLMVPKASPLGSSCTPKQGDDASYDGCFDDLAGKNVAVAASGTTNKHLVEESARMVKAGKPAVVVRAFDSNADAIQAVVSGQADAGYLNDPQAAFFINRSNSNYKLAFAGYASNELALTTLKANTALADAFVTALTAMKADGTYKKILDKWGVAEATSFTYQK
jgi:polar amino acid transport system substrate-binding protein